MADEHYFQNYVNRHYSPNARSLVLKYQRDLKAAAAPASPLATAAPGLNNKARPELIRAASRGSVQTTSEPKASRSFRHNGGTAIPMPEAPMPFVQVQHAPSAMDILCDAAVASQAPDSLVVNGGDQQDKGIIWSSRQKGRRHVAIIDEDTDDAPDASKQSGSGSASKSPAQREVRTVQRDQRRTRKAAHRHAQPSDLEPQTAASDTRSPPPTGPLHLQTGHYNGPVMHGPPPAYFGIPYSMQPGYPPPQAANAFPSNYAAQSNGFHPYSGPPAHFGGAPGYNFHPPWGYGGPSPQHTVPYMGNYYTPGYAHNNGQGYGNGYAYMDGGMGVRESMNGQNGGIGPSPGPDEEDTQNGDSK